MNTHGTGIRIMALTEAPFCSLRARRDSAVQRPVKRPHSSAEIGIAASAIRVPDKITSAESEQQSGRLHAAVPWASNFAQHSAGRDYSSGTAREVFFSHEPTAAHFARHQPDFRRVTTTRFD